MKTRDIVVEYLNFLRYENALEREDPIIVSYLYCFLQTGSINRKLISMFIDNNDKKLSCNFNAIRNDLISKLDNYIGDDVQYTEAMYLSTTFLSYMILKECDLYEIGFVCDSRLEKCMEYVVSTNRKLYKKVFRQIENVNVVRTKDNYIVPEIISKYCSKFYRLD